MSEINATNVSQIKDTELSGNSTFQSDTNIDHQVVNKTENNIDHQTVKHIHTNANKAYNLGKMLENAQSTIENLSLSNKSLVTQLDKERERNESTVTENAQLRNGLIH